MEPIRFELTLTHEAALEIKRLAETYGASVSRIARGDSMLESHRVSGQIDDDFLRRLMNAIGEACGVNDDPRPSVEVVREYIDGDLAIAYEETLQMFTAAYPGLYGDAEVSGQ